MVMVKNDNFKLHNNAHCAARERGLTTRNSLRVLKPELENSNLALLLKLK